MTTDQVSEPEPPSNAPKRSLSRFWKWTKRLLLLIFGFLGIYVLLILVGLIPVNRNFVETTDGVQIFVFSGPFHSDLILPIDNSIIDWRSKFAPTDFRTSTPWATHIAFGWGDKDFYINTPNWADLKISTAASAILVPTDTVMHVAHQSQPPTDDETQSVRISIEQYQKLVEFVSGSFELGSTGEFQLIPGKSYGSSDAFYWASGRYHCFRTCNCWVGDGLKSAGIKTGWFTPLPRTVFLYFPE